jgi:flagellar biosynthesis chaperone FliJ
MKTEEEIEKKLDSLKARYDDLQHNVDFYGLNTMSASLISEYNMLAAYISTLNWVLGKPFAK